MEPNSVRQKLGRGRVVTGSVLYSWSPNVAEAAGQAGLDFIRIDNEHAWRQDSSAEQIIRAAALVDLVPIMRVDRDNPFLIRKALEIGAGGILVPDIHSPMEAQKVVEAAKFPPEGRRGYSGNCWSAAWGARAGAEWIKWSNSEPMIGVMIENQEAVKCVEQIIAVEGLDFVYFGPADYSMSIGLGEPNRDHEQVRSALKRTIAAAKKADKHVMYNAGLAGEEIKRCVKMGVTMIELSNDLWVIKSILGEAVKLVEGVMRVGPNVIPKRGRR